MRHENESSEKQKGESLDCVYKVCNSGIISHTTNSFVHPK